LAPTDAPYAWQANSDKLARRVCTAMVSGWPGSLDGWLAELAGGWLAGLLAGRLSRQARWPFRWPGQCGSGVGQCGRGAESAVLGACAKRAAAIELVQRGARKGARHQRERRWALAALWAELAGRLQSVVCARGQPPQMPPGHKAAPAS